MLRLIEKTLAALASIGLLLMVIRFDGSHAITLLAGLTISLLYWPLGFAVLTGIQGRDLFRGSAYRERGAGQLVMAAIIGMCLSMLIFAILFSVMGYEGARFLRVFGIIGMVLMLGASLPFRQRWPRTTFRGWVVRGALAFAVLVLVEVLPIRHHSNADQAVPTVRPH